MLKAIRTEAYYKTRYGRMYCVDSLEFMRSEVGDSSVDLIMTSPPFGLVRKKTYGNVDADNYVTWFHPFGLEFHRVLKPNGSLVIDIGGAWNRGQPTRNLYHFELLIMLCKDLGFHLAQEIFWWNPSKLPTPAEWVTVRRVRVKDAVNCVWWLSKTPWPKASNRRVLIPYSDSMKKTDIKQRNDPAGTTSAPSSTSTTTHQSPRISWRSRTPKATPTTCVTAKRKDYPNTRHAFRATCPSSLSECSPIPGNLSSTPLPEVA